MLAPDPNEESAVRINERAATRTDLGYGTPGENSRRWREQSWLVQLAQLGCHEVWRLAFNMNARRCQLIVQAAAEIVYIRLGRAVHCVQGVACIVSANSF